MVRKCTDGALAQPVHWRFRFLVALPTSGDLFICAKDLFIAAIDGKRPQPLTAGASWQSGTKRRVQPFPLCTNCGETCRAERPLVARPTSWVLFISAKNLLVEAKQAPAPKLLI
jgi:hypothetical protein